MKKNGKIIIGVIAVILFCLFAFENIILVSVVKNGAKYVLDIKTRIRKIAVQPLKAKVAVKGLKLFNPPGYKIDTLAQIPLVLLDFKPRTFLERGAFFDKIEVEIAEINIIKDKDGIINLSKLKGFVPEKKEPKPFYADKYIVKIGKVNYIDRTKEENQTKEIILNLDLEYSAVEDPENLANIVAYKLFIKAGIAGVGLELQRVQKKLAKLAERNKNLEEELKTATGKDLTGSEVPNPGITELTKEAVAAQVEKTKESISKKVETVNKVISVATGSIQENNERESGGE